MSTTPPAHDGSIEEIRNFLEGDHGEVSILAKASREEKSVWISETLQRLDYFHLPREDKGTLRTYLQTVTGYSRAQIARYIQEFNVMDTAVENSPAPRSPRLLRTGVLSSVALGLIMTFAMQSNSSPTAKLIADPIEQEIVKLIPVATKTEKLADTRNTVIPEAIIQKQPVFTYIQPQKKIVVLQDPNGVPTQYPLLLESDAVIKRRTRRLNRLESKSAAPTKPFEDAPSALLKDRRVNIERGIFPTKNIQGPAQAGGMLPRPDIAIIRNTYPKVITTTGRDKLFGAAPELTAQSQMIFDIFGYGREGQTMMIVNGEPIWTDLPYREQLMRLPTHSAAATDRSGGGRRGGGGGGGTTTTTNNVTNTTINQAFGWAESSDGTVVYLSTSTDTLGLGTSTPETKLEVVGTISGASLVISDLRNCDTIDTDANGVLTCGSDDTGTGSLSQTQADNRYVNTSGDTMTGSLIVLSNGQFSGSLTGATILATTTLASSGNLVIAGNARFNSGVILNGITYTFPVGDGSASGKVLATDGNGQLSWTAAGSGNGDLSLADANERFVLVQGDTMTGGLLITLGGSASEQIESGLAFEVIGTLSGTIIHAQDSITSSGTLIVEGNARFNSGVILNGVTYTFPVGDGSASGKVLKTDSNGQLAWSDDDGTSYYAGQGLGLNATLFTLNSVLTGTSLNFTTISGSTLFAQNGITTSGSLVVENNVTVNGIVSGATIRGAGLYDCDAAGSKLVWDVTTGQFSCGADVDTDTDTTYSAGEGISLNGTVFTVNDSLTGTLLDFVTVSGATVFAQDGITTSGSVIVESDVLVHGNISGATIAGAGLYDCDAAGSKLLWDSTTKTFSCGTDADTADTNTTYEAGEGLSLNGTLFTLNDSLTGTLLDFVTISGATLHAADLITSSGSMIVESNLTVHGIMSGSTLYGAGLYDCDAAGDTLQWDVTTGQFSCGTDADTNTTYEAGEGLNLNGTLFTLNNSISGTLLDFDSFSGATVHAGDLITSSGSLIVESNITAHGIISGATLFGAGLYDCDGANDKLVWNVSTGQFSCGTDVDTDTDTTYEAGEGLSLNGTLFTLND
ncbi:MAG: hypothetical protein O2904_04965, partial [bacterium]|nr:hypothetical protein [bacterium]